MVRMEQPFCTDLLPKSSIMSLKNKVVSHMKTAFEIGKWRGGGRRFAGIQRDSKRWTHFVSLYGLNGKRCLNTRQTVVCGIPSSLLALGVDSRGLRSKLS